MATEVGLAYGIDPRVIYEKWYPPQLISVYAYIVNKMYKEKYNQLDENDKLKYPEVMVARYLNKEEERLYERQLSKKKSKLAKNFGKYNKK